VDNNTWNNTHIATVGRALATTEEEAYPIMESLDVDYVLVIFGGMTGYSSDDINKFLWPVRIGSGVYPNDMPSERDFYSAQGNFDVGPGGSPKLLNCVAYKLCYYRFSEMHTEYGKPAGYDRARQREVGNKDISLSTMEEAFTSEHWIVRIYKVLPRPTFEPTPSMKASKKSKGKKNKGKKSKGKGKKSKGKGDTGEEETEFTAVEESRYVGCFVSEGAFGERAYEGGGTGANHNLALYHAKVNGKRYFAVARAVGDGHAFAFDEIDPNAVMTSGEGCERPCADAEDKMCGCMDAECTGRTPAGEEHNRRWAVYEVIY
jgi:dolichyl-diphosphooligosaccharide--protein glycosyltransferase